MNFWFTYLLWNALADQPDKRCNVLHGKSYIAGIEVFFQLLTGTFTLLTLAIQSTSDHKLGRFVAEDHFIFRINNMAFMNQFVLMMAPSFYLYVFFNFSTLRLGPE